MVANGTPPPDQRTAARQAAPTAARPRLAGDRVAGCAGCPARAPGLPGFPFGAPAAGLAALLAEAPPLPARPPGLAVPEPAAPRAGLAAEVVPVPGFRPAGAVPRLPDLPVVCRVAIRCSRWLT